MGRNPLKTRIGQYLAANEGVLAEATLKERGRKLEAFQKRCADAFADKPDLKRDPALWGEAEIKEILADIRARGWSPTTQSRELENIQAVLRYVGNAILDNMKFRYPYLFPKRVARRGPSLDESQRDAILAALEGIPGWTGQVAKMLVYTHLMTGLRPKELRMAHVDDIDTTNWTIRVRHPKGEGCYGAYRVIPIPCAMRPVVLAYLSARERILSEHGLLDANPLLCRKDDPTRFYSANRLQKVKAQVEAVSGVGFELRALRRTYGQMLLDGGGDLETASGALGHNSLKTTQKYYCQRSIDAVNREILRIMDGSMPASPGTKNPVISRSDDYTGYA